MKGSGLTAAARPTVWTIAACCCLSLSACSGTSPGAQPDAATSKAIPRASQKFCQQMDNLLDSLDSHGLTHSMTLTDARTDVDDVLKSAIADFKKLEAQAPASLKASVRDVEADFRAFKRKSDKASSVSQLMADTTHRSPVQTRPYLRVLAYAGRAC
jgi:hypothetical protein